VSAPSDTLRIRSQLLFVEEQPGALRLDGALMQEAVAGVPSGSPLSLLLRAPASSAVASVVEATLHRWVEHLDVVDIELVGGTDRPHVALSDGTSTIRLAVQPARLSP
jgi:hypothetical protein